jgi:hypothetical protein
MVYGCMPYHGLGKLVVIDETIDSISCTCLLSENLYESAEMMGLSNGFVFQ